MARTTFAKRPPAPPPAPLRARSGPLALLANPFVGAGGAALLLALTAVSLVMITGDPKAGTPIVRLSLAHVGETSGPPGWKAALPQETPGEAPFVDGAVELSSSSSSEVADAGPMNGQAIITLPGGGHADSARADPRRRRLESPRCRH